jgi:hypothetical protein
VCVGVLKGKAEGNIIILNQDVEGVLTYQCNKLNMADPKYATWKGSHDLRNGRMPSGYSVLGLDVQKKFRPGPHELHPVHC